MKTIHYSFVLLEEGKMSTRKGNLVLLEDFMEEAVKKAKAEIKKRHEKVNENSAKAIGYGAIKYSILRVSPEKNVIFNWLTHRLSELAVQATVAALPRLAGYGGEHHAGWG